MSAAGMLEELLIQLRPSEGWSPELYIDTTGNLTIGYGFNLAKIVAPVDWKAVKIRPVGEISAVIGEQLLLGKVLETVEEMRRRYPWIDSLDEVRQRVLLDMGYNMGPAFLDTWPIFVSQLKCGDFLGASRNMLATKWADDVGGEPGQRAWRLARMMESGKDSKPLTRQARRSRRRTQ